jgi:hypothetical protein
MWRETGNLLGSFVALDIPRGVDLGWLSPLLCRASRGYSRSGPHNGQSLAG